MHVHEGNNNGKGNKVQKTFLKAILCRLLNGDGKLQTTGTLFLLKKEKIFYEWR